MCPVCSIGVVVSLGFSRWLKVDDSITGVWIGALLLGLSIWTLNWLFRKKEKKPPALLPLIVAGYWLLTFWPLYATDIISNTNCLLIWGLNRLLFGSFCGLAVAGLALFLDRFSRRLNAGRRVFPYQKIAFPLGLLLIASLILNSIC